MLYIVPATIIGPVLVAAVRGELRALFEYNDAPETGDSKKTKSLSE